MNKRQAIWLAIALAVCAAYGNSFENGFHFDDFHTVVDNPAIRSLHNTGRFFTDATSFSVLPQNRTYRPFVSASLALDYALGHGYTPFWFHLSTLLVFLAQLAAMYWLYQRIAYEATADDRDSSASDGRLAADFQLAALAAVAWYGLHPAMAETVNYIIQRGDIYSTLGVVASLAIFACRPRWRRTGLYLLPFVFGVLSKPPAIVLPALLFAYVAYFESQSEGLPIRLRRATVAVLPSIAVGAAAIWLQAVMTPKTYAPSIISSFDYRVTQPFVLMRYFGSFFLPVHLNVDTDLQPFTGFTVPAVLGILFLAALGFAIWRTARTKSLRPISFGLLWFVVASIPTSVYRLSEVENDHRMYMPFVGLTLAVTWGLWLLVERLAVLHPQLPLRKGAVTMAVVLLGAYGFAVHERNRVWRTEETLWLDDVQKSPHNGRGLMNYGLTQMARGAYPEALDYFERALRFTPNYAALEINLGVVNGAMADGGRPELAAEAERHFQRAMALTPGDEAPHTYYGRWLKDHGRQSEAATQLEQAVMLNPQRLYPRELLVDAYAREGNGDAARRVAQAGLDLAPDDAVFRQMLTNLGNGNAAYWINLSLAQYQAKQYAQSIESARYALQLDPRSAEAYNNIGAAYGTMSNWDAGIEAENEALKLNPQLQIAQNNLRWFAAEKAKAASNGIAAKIGKSADDFLNDSVQLNRAGRLEESTAAARAALNLNPAMAEAWNNIAANDEALQRWDAAIVAAQKAIALKPEFQLARNNLAWSLSQKSLSQKQLQGKRRSPLAATGTVLARREEPGGLP